MEGVILMTRLLSAKVHMPCWWRSPPSLLVTLHRWLSSQCTDRVYIPAARPATRLKVPLTRLRHFLPSAASAPCGRPRQAQFAVI